MLKYEPMKFYKPVMIPWNNISISRSKESLAKGFDDFIVSINGEHLGTVSLQVPISDQIQSEAEELGAELNLI